MEINSLLTLIGLCLDLVGVLLLFFYSLPINISHKSGVTFYLTEEQPIVNNKNKKRYKLTKAALIFICLGFLLQIIGTIIG